MKKIKAILFDLDGTLVEAKDFHYRALNKALEAHDVTISKEEHLSTYDGLSTRTKLKMLSEHKGLSVEKHDEIYTDKQKLTFEFIETYCKKDIGKIKLIKNLKNEGYKVGCCSNAIRKSVVTMLKKIGVYNLMDVVVSNQDVYNPKPFPDIYNKAIKELNLTPQECLAVEDNERGIKSALASGVNILRVYSVKECNIINLFDKLYKLNTKERPDLNIVIPMAGEGSRFRKKGYKDPKPFIDIEGKTMIERVLDNLKTPGSRFILIARKDHMVERADVVAKVVNKYNAVFIPINNITEGSACTVMFARKYINNDTPLVLANSDQIIDSKLGHFVGDAKRRNLDGSLMTFYSEGEDKWSFTKTDDKGSVTEVAEKVPISNHANTGIYYYDKGLHYINSTIDMIANNSRVRGEFYTAPTYNYMIKDGKKIGIYKLLRKNMHGIGTPQDLEKYLEGVKNGTYNLPQTS